MSNNNCVCHFCGEKIGWIRGANGHMIPVAPEPFQIRRGTAYGMEEHTYLLRNGDTVIGYAVGDAAEGNDIVEGYVPHKAVCPMHMRHERRRKR